jgi:hypothetical protein
VGDGRVGGQFWIVAEHGTKAGYVRNIETNSRVRLKLREGFRSRWHKGTADILTDDDPRAQDWLGSAGVRGRQQCGGGAIFRNGIAYGEN